MEKLSMCGVAEPIPVVEEFEEWESLAFCWLNIGHIRFKKADYDGAFEAYTRGSEMAQQVGAEAIHANCLLNTGLIFEQRGNPEQAMEYYKTALKGFQRSLDEKGLIRCVQTIETCASKLKWRTNSTDRTGYFS